MAEHGDSDKAKRKTVKEKVIAEFADDRKGLSGLDAFLTDLTVDRFVAANAWQNEQQVDGAVKQLAETWRWRVESQPRWICCHLCIQNPMSHSMRAIGFDTLGRLVFYSCFATSPFRDSRSNINHLQRCMEDAQVVLDRNPSGPGKWVFFRDFYGFAISDASPSTASNAIWLLQHYPERLGLCVIYDAGAIFDSLWAVIKPMLNDVTAQKVCFASSLEDGDTLDSTLLNLGAPVLDWLRLETAENRTPFAETKRYWEPSGGCVDETRPPHDPRGTKAFVESETYGDFLSYGDGAGADTVPVVDFKVDRIFNGKLGVRLKNITVSGLDVPEAGDFWNVGDEVLEINGVPIGDSTDFRREILEAIKALPFTVKVFRHGERTDGEA